MDNTKTFINVRQIENGYIVGIERAAAGDRKYEDKDYYCKDFMAVVKLISTTLNQSQGGES